MYRYKTYNDRDPLDALHFPSFRNMDIYSRWSGFFLFCEYKSLRPYQDAVQEAAFKGDPQAVLNEWWKRSPQQAQDYMTLMVYTPSTVLLFLSNPVMETHPCMPNDPNFHWDKKIGQYVRVDWPQENYLLICLEPSYPTYDKGTLLHAVNITEHEWLDMVTEWQRWVTDTTNSYSMGQSGFGRRHSYTGMRWPGKSEWLNTSMAP